MSRDGHLLSLYDHQAARESLAPGSQANHFVLFDDRPNNWEAWDVDIFHLEKRDEVPGAQSARVLEAGPLRAAVEFDYELSPKSWIKQVVSLDALSSRLDFANEVEWQERRRYLKVEFPLEIHAEQATYEMQFGHVQRPTHFNTTWDMARFEVCGHKWADLAEPGFGVALLTDSKYGYAAHRNVLRLSLLRGPTSPDPLADLGRHHFRYALLPHAADFRAAGVIDEGYRFNVPLLVQPVPPPSPAERSPSSRWTAQRGDRHRQAGRRFAGSDRAPVRKPRRPRAVRLSSPLPVQAAALCNLLEEEERHLVWQDGGVTLNVLPFKVITVKLKV